MPLINIKRVIPDMLLEESIKNFTGQVLLGRGTNLTSMNIKNLKAWGITEIAVLDNSSKRELSLKKIHIDPKLLEETQSEMEELFCRSNRDHPAIKEMLRLSILKRLKNKPGMEDIDVY